MMPVVAPTTDHRHCPATKSWQWFQRNASRADVAQRDPLRSLERRCSKYSPPLRWIDHIAPTPLLMIAAGATSSRST